MIRVFAIALFLFAPSHAWTQAPPSPAPVAAPAAPQNAPAFNAFVATEVAQLDQVYDMNVGELRVHALYPPSTDALRAAIGPDTTARAFVDALQADLDKLRSSRKFDDDVGRRALAELDVIVHAHLEALARIEGHTARPDLPLAGALGRREFPKDDFKSTDHIPLGSAVPTGGAGWRIEVFAGDRWRIPLLARFTGGANDRFATYLTSEQYVCIRAFCDAAWRVRDGVVPIQTIAAELEQYDVAWDNYLQRGYPQFPWENLLNDRLVDSAWNRPPDWQLVFLHPAPGFVCDVESVSRAELDAALLLHTIGYVEYHGDDRGWYLGGSATLALTPDDERGLAYGLTLHYGFTREDSPLPQIDIGILRSEGDEEDGWMLAVGFDAARLLAP